eukprot:CAMPEP_0197049088 /NCGR_PEP_ID=MMETSP1384-20130603/24307_1 /TAXON_ID=29189 /ORGANISM="Ammonia sp." /LENGTH=289 /DNA_ID=CAMNT_0042481315 /DNA_START=86 /DNA_END=955 /DNA_ORIENTATION=+
MQEADWWDIVQQEDTKQNDEDDTTLKLPPPEIIELNASGTLQKEITYEFDENDANKIIRTERIFEIVETTKKMSTSCIKRRANWTKFGQVANIPKGTIERGVTSQRSDDAIQFLWSGRKHRPQIAEKQSKRVDVKPMLKKAPEDNKQDTSLLSESESKPIARTGYVAPSLRGMAEEEKIEIKISNLPQWASWDDVKYLVDAFYKTHLKRHYVPKYKIVMIPSRRRLEEWNADPDYYKEQLAEYERKAIVEFDSIQDAQTAIQVLNGHRYEYNVLQVERAAPRNTFSRTR